MVRKNRKLNAGITLVEMLTVLGLIGVLIAVLIPAVLRARATARGTQCLNNLRQIALGFQFYAEAHRNRFPQPSDKPWEMEIAPHLEMQQGVFHCPADTATAKDDLSYEWRDDYTILEPARLGGKRRDQVAHTKIVLVFDQLAGWHHPAMVNAAMVDGAAVSMSAEDFEMNLLSDVADGELLFTKESFLEDLKNGRGLIDGLRK